MSLLGSLVNIVIGGTSPQPATYARQYELPKPQQPETPQAANAISLEGKVTLRPDFVTDITPFLSAEVLGGIERYALARDRGGVALYTPMQRVFWNLPIPGEMIRANFVTVLALQPDGTLIWTPLSMKTGLLTPEHDGRPIDNTTRVYNTRPYFEVATAALLAGQVTPRIRESVERGFGIDAGTLAPLSELPDSLKRTAYNPGKWYPLVNTVVTQLPVTDAPASPILIILEKQLAEADARFEKWQAKNAAEKAAREQGKAAREQKKREDIMAFLKKRKAEGTPYNLLTKIFGNDPDLISREDYDLL